MPDVRCRGAAFLHSQLIFQWHIPLRRPEWEPEVTAWHRLRAHNAPLSPFFNRTIGGMVLASEGIVALIKTRWVSGQSTLNQLSNDKTPNRCLAVTMTKTSVGHRTIPLYPTIIFLYYVIPLFQTCTIRRKLTTVVDPLPR